MTFPFLTLGTMYSFTYIQQVGLTYFHISWNLTNKEYVSTNPTTLDSSKWLASLNSSSAKSPDRMLLWISSITDPQPCFYFFWCILILLMSLIKLHGWIAYVTSYLYPQEYVKANNFQLHGSCLEAMISLYWCFINGDVGVRVLINKTPSIFLIIVIFFKWWSFTSLDLNLIILIFIFFSNKILMATIPLSYEKK